MSTTPTTTCPFEHIPNSDLEAKQIEHQPIGSINRLRKDVYAASAKHHGASMPELDLSQEGERS